MSQLWEKTLLKTDIIKENNMLQTFNWETAKIKLHQYASLLKSPKFDATNIKWFAVGKQDHNAQINQYPIMF